MHVYRCHFHSFIYLYVWLKSSLSGLCLSRAAVFNAMMGFSNRHLTWNAVIFLCWNHRTLRSPSPLSSVRAEASHQPPRDPEPRSTACCSEWLRPPPRQPPRPQRECEPLCLPRSPATLLRCAALGPRRPGTDGERAHAKLSNQGGMTSRSWSLSSEQNCALKQWLH